MTPSFDSDGISRIRDCNDVNIYGFKSLIHFLKEYFLFLDHKYIYLGYKHPSPSYNVMLCYKIRLIFLKNCPCIV